MQDQLGQVRLTAVGELRKSDDGTPYFTVQFKRGPFGRPVTRVMFGSEEDDGSIRWRRISREDALALMKADLSGHVFIESAEIEPEEIVSQKTGEVVTITSRTVARFADETLEQAIRRNGSRLRQEKPQENAQELSPGAFAVVGLNGAAAS